MKTSYSRCDDHDSLSWIFILQAHQRNRPQVDTQTHPDTLTQFRANKSLFFVNTPFTFLAWYRHVNNNGGVKLVLWVLIFPLSEMI